MSISSKNLSSFIDHLETVNIK